MNTQHYYTSTGFQRYVKVEGTVRYDLETAPAGSAVYYTDDSIESVRAGKANWTKLLDNSGVIAGATALRVEVGTPNASFALLTVEHGVTDPVLGCAGELARMNATLAVVNADLRFCADVA
jgi:hypothetical protein